MPQYYWTINKRRGLTASAQQQAVLRREYEDYAERYQEVAIEKRKQLERRRRKPITVHVQILTGRRIHIFLDRYDTLDTVRDKIKTKEGIPVDQQILLLNGIQLIEHDSDTTIYDLNIRDQAVLFLTLRNRGG